MTKRNHSQVIRHRFCEFFIYIYIVLHLQYASAGFWKQALGIHHEEIFCCIQKANMTWNSLLKRTHTHTHDASLAASMFFINSVLPKEFGLGCGLSCVTL